MLRIIKARKLTLPETAAAERQHYNPASNPKPEIDERLEQLPVCLQSDASLHRRRVPL